MDKILTKTGSDCARLSQQELRCLWAECWGFRPHAGIGKQMLIRSLEYKQSQLCGQGLSGEQQKRLDNLVAQYKRDPKSFERGPVGLKPGTRLVRSFNGDKHVVTVKEAGFEYRKREYSSLSEVAYAITGTRWNGWVFFGIKKKRRRAV